MRRQPPRWTCCRLSRSLLCVQMWILDLHQCTSVVGANYGLDESAAHHAPPAPPCLHPCRSLPLSSLPLPSLQVLKMKFAAPITGADVGLKREWIIGQHLNTLSDDGDEMSGAASHTRPSQAGHLRVVRLT